MKLVLTATLDGGKGADLISGAAGGGADKIKGWGGSDQLSGGQETTG